MGKQTVRHSRQTDKQIIEKEGYRLTLTDIVWQTDKQFDRKLKVRQIDEQMNRKTDRQIKRYIVEHIYRKIDK